MFIWLPPSEGKTAPESGPAWDPASGVFEALAAPRLRVIDEAVASAAVGSPNADLRHAPSAPARELFTGVLFAAANFGEMDGAEGQQARTVVRVFSGLAGVVALDDLLPDHKLPMGSRLGECGVLSTFWRDHLDQVLGNEAAEELILDCRSGPYRSACRAPWAHVVELAVVREAGGKRQVISHDAKRWRGMMTGALLRSGEDITDINDRDSLVDAMRSLAPELVAVDAKGVEHRVTGVEITPAKSTRAGGSHCLATLVTN